MIDRGFSIFKSKQFGFKNKVDQIKSLNEAIKYRDSQITIIINLISNNIKNEVLNLNNKP